MVEYGLYNIIHVYIKKGGLNRVKSQLTHPMRIRLEQDLEKQIAALAERRGESKAELCRRLLRKAVQQELAGEGIDEIYISVRRAMQDVLKPVEERLAKISAKSAIASATSMYTNAEVLGSMGKDVKAIHERSRKKAVSFVKTPNDQLLGDE